MRSFSLLFIFCLLLLVAVIEGKYDCYKYGPSEFTIVVECSKGCEYSYRDSGDSLKRLQGGCSENDSEKCRTSGDLITCTCKGDKCNIKGYEMESSHSAES